MCRHRCLKCPGRRRRLLLERLPAQLCGPGTSPAGSPRFLPSRPSSCPPPRSAWRGRLRGCRRRRRCCEHIPPGGLNAAAGVGRESGSPNFPLCRSSFFPAEDPLEGSRGSQARARRRGGRAESRKSTGAAAACARAPAARRPRGKCARWGERDALQVGRVPELAAPRRGRGCPERGGADGER